METRRRKVVFSIVGGVILLAILGTLITLFILRDRLASIISFRDCVDRGYSVTGTNPRKCTGPDGKVFFEPQSDEKNNGTADGNNQQTPSTNPPIQNNDRQVLSLAVYFSKEPDSFDDFTYTEAVTRSSSRIDMGTYTIEQLIAGPSEIEASRGLRSPLKGKLQGESNCSGKDFTLSVAERVARLRFCRTIASAGIGDDARITATVSDTLEQFSSVDSVVILTRDGDCFGDQSGQNLCLQ